MKHQLENKNSNEINSFKGKYFEEKCLHKSDFKRVKKKFIQQCNDLHKKRVIYQ